jgi:hypothetical protein
MDHNSQKNGAEKQSSSVSNLLQQHHTHTRQEIFGLKFRTTHFVFFFVPSFSLFSFWFLFSKATQHHNTTRVPQNTKKQKERKETRNSSLFLLSPLSFSLCMADNLRTKRKHQDDDDDEDSSEMNDDNQPQNRADEETRNAFIQVKTKGREKDKEKEQKNSNRHSQLAFLTAPAQRNGNESPQPSDWVQQPRREHFFPLFFFLFLFLFLVSSNFFFFFFLSSPLSQLVESLKASSVITSARVEDAMLTLPRGLFVPDDLQDEAYVDSPLRLASMGFNISAPHMYGVCLETLNIQPGNSFLDIGSGCGHFTALAGYLVKVHKTQK